MRTYALKRVLDFTGAAVLLILVSPVLLITTICVRIAMGAPVFFRNERAGLDGRPFRLYKFRTMSNDRDAGGALLPDAERLTPFGAFLRSTSLDELPTLWNVVRGDMSLVGPRPLLTSYLDRYSPEQARRHETRPGITGWAQINGRNAIDWDDKFRFDVWYVDHMSLGLDLKILWSTLGKVVKREGISAENEATMPEFKGPGR